MDISWLGNSALRIQSGQTAIVCDPYQTAAGWAMPPTAADIVTISRDDDPRHSNFGAVDGSPRVLHGPGEYEIANFYISGMGTPCSQEAHDDAAQRQVNTVYTMRAEGLRICHAGAIIPTLTSRQLDELNNTEVLVVEAGSAEDSAARRVARLVNQIGPRIVVPVGWHASTPDDTSPLQPLLAELGVTEADSQASLRITATNLPREMRVVALRPVR